MRGYATNIKKLSGENENFREVLYTVENSQIALMPLCVGKEIG